MVFLVSARENIYYLSGFFGSDSRALITPRKAFLITDFRYREEAEESVAPGFEIIQRESKSLSEESAALLSRCKIRRLGFESRRLSWADHENLAVPPKTCPPIDLIPAGDMVENLRLIKENDEIELISRAAAIGDRVLRSVLADLKIGMKESDLAAALIFQIRSAGARPAFEPIVASASHSSRPHARSSGRPLAAGDILLVDMGVNYRGYNSDMTRTLFLGRPAEDFKKIYLLVREAQKRALAGIAPGVEIASVDAAARDYLEKKGYGSFFGHALGHGIGLEVHEKPSLRRRSQKVFHQGMVCTVEPGIYLPGRGGVRIEDTVLVTSDGCRCLTKAHKDLHLVTLR